MYDLDHILVFKTDISSSESEARIHPILSNHKGISQWNVDMEDVDCVLRIISDSLSHDEVIALVNEQGHFCSELQ
ncbi:MAG: hypothetical protein V7724_05575 [Sediminicola sp.]|tara:strand:+ start:94390 stop:94614 length:225 start_codon:yes stop_codon:yes gene_type:complete